MRFSSNLASSPRSYGTRRRPRRDGSELPGERPRGDLPNAPPNISSDRDRGDRRGDWYAAPASGVEGFRCALVLGSRPTRHCRRTGASAAALPLAAGRCAPSRRRPLNASIVGQLGQLVVIAEKVRCPCCASRTLRERGVDDICQVCWWHDDGQDDVDADEVRGGPNGNISLTQARASYREIGASDPRFVGHVRRPTPSEAP